MNAMPAWCHGFSDEQLRNAWTRARRPGWPATFEEAMNDPFYARLVASAAKHPPRPQLEVVRYGWPFMASRRHRGLPPAPAPRSSMPVFDIKRAAAGDRDD